MWVYGPVEDKFEAKWELQKDVFLLQW
jgi:hypothetical protein